jgi:hypothetical protein
MSFEAVFDLDADKVSGQPLASVMRSLRVTFSREGGNRSKRLRKIAKERRRPGIAL